MKAKFLQCINALLEAAIIGLIGTSFSNCRTKYGVPELEYGSPYATYEVSGVITDEEEKTVANIRVTVQNDGYQILPEAYSEEDGLYSAKNDRAFPFSRVEIIAEDTSGVYSPDTARVDVRYDRTGVSSSDNWNEGSASILQDFQLKKKK